MKGARVESPIVSHVITAGTASIQNEHIQRALDEITWPSDDDRDNAEESEDGDDDDEMRSFIIAQQHVF
jgi:hypothetical protein